MKTARRIVAMAALCAILLTSLVTPAAAANITACKSAGGALALLVQLVRTLEKDGGVSLSAWLSVFEPPEVPLGPITSEVPVQTEPQPQAPIQPQAPTQPAKPETVVSAERAFEVEVVRLVNAIRAEYGLNALAENTALSDGARAKSRDMAQSGYFDHNSPTYGSPFDMMRSFGFSYRAAGENIAKGYASAQAVVDAWMASSGHRENILSTQYTEIGVGYIADGQHCTQWFLG